jgi:hypothetical protein
MPKLTRRKYPERVDCWHIYYGDVQVGAFARRSGCPVDVDPWEWGCGFYPGTEPGQGESGTAASFEEARADFEAAWREFLPRLTEANFQEWRDQRDWTAWKYEMLERGAKMPTQVVSGISQCFCGTTIDIPGVSEHVRTAHMGSE